MEKSIWQLPFKVIKKYQFFRRSQYWSKDRLHDFQIKNLKKLIRHSYTNVPYYTELFNKIDLKPEDITELSDLQKIPILDKEIVRTRTKDLTAGNARHFGMNWDSTSGSTGKPLHFITDNSTQSAKIAALLRSYNWAGYRIGNRMLSMQSYYFSDRDYRYNRLYNVLRFDSNRVHTLQVLLENIGYPID